MFCSHLLRQFYEKDDKMKATKVPQWQRHRPILSPHKETVQHIDVLQNPKRYITISKVWRGKMSIIWVILSPFYLHFNKDLDLILTYYDTISPGGSDRYLGYEDEADQSVEG